MLLSVVSFRKESVLITGLQYIAGYMQATTFFNRRWLHFACTQCLNVVQFFVTALRHRSGGRYSIFP
jgi:hypothetical protein